LVDQILRLFNAWVRVVPFIWTYSSKQEEGERYYHKSYGKSDPRVDGKWISERKEVWRRFRWFLK